MRDRKSDDIPNKVQVAVQILAMQPNAVTKCEAQKTAIKHAWKIVSDYLGVKEEA